MKNKKISKILIGSNNQGKLREITSLLPKNVKVFSTKDFNLKSPKETGETFKSNALIKAKYFSKKTDLICLSDDSGLEIDLLKKKPGIYSARWGGKKSDCNKAMERVYKELDKKDKQWREKKITARFICALVIYWPNRKKIYSVGKFNNDKKMAEILNCADIIAIPSKVDNLPQVGIEAQSCGLPVVTFNCNGLKDLVVHKKDGFLAKPYDHISLANGIDWTLKYNLKKKY